MKIKDINTLGKLTGYIKQGEITYKFTDDTGSIELPFDDMVVYLEEIQKPIPKRKYIDDLGIPYAETPQGFNTRIRDGRLINWKNQRDTFGFDEREVWGLDLTFLLWLYERLRMYDEKNYVDTSFHKFEHRGKTLTFQQCINKMLQNLKVVLVDTNIDNVELVDEILDLFKLCFHCLWF